MNQIEVIEKISKLFLKSFETLRFDINSRVKVWKSDEKISIEVPDFSSILEEYKKVSTQEVIQFLQSQSEAVENGEMSPIEAYRRLRGLKEIIDTCIWDIESDVKAEITRNPKDYFDFSLSTRRTLQYKQCEVYNQKQEELKAIEEKIKIATEMHAKWDTYVDSDGVIIEPVEVKYTEVLTYKPKR